jgi:hypothetical protein
VKLARVLFITYLSMIGVVLVAAFVIGAVWR